MTITYDCYRTVQSLMGMGDVLIYLQYYVIFFSKLSA